MQQEILIVCFVVGVICLFGLCLITQPKPIDDIKKLPKAVATIQYDSPIGLVQEIKE